MKQSFKLLSFTAMALSLLAVATAVQAEPATYSIDPTHTFATFEVKHFGTSTNRGRFDKTSGTVTLDAAAKTGQANITIEMGSINTGTAPFDAHLKSKDFFDVQAHPQAMFVSSKFVYEGDKLVEVQGTLTLLGKGQPVTLKAQGFGCYENPRLKRQVCGGDFVTSFLRSTFGMGYAIPFVPDEVKMLIQVEAVKQ
jgi:polyisoprenoid-binding protein YceI